MAKSRILVTGAGGFIGHHLVSHLKSHGHWVRGVDLQAPEFARSQADEYVVGDMRSVETCTCRLFSSTLTPAQTRAISASLGTTAPFASASTDKTRNARSANDSGRSPRRSWCRTRSSNTRPSRNWRR